jgi:3-dehydroquinate synthase
MNSTFQIVEKYLDVPVYFNYPDEALIALCSKYNNLVIICDHHTKQHCLPKIDFLFSNRNHIEVITIAAGETSKSMKTIENIIAQLLAKDLSKQTLMIGLGGGIVTDITGFAASIYKRGIDFVCIPTTLLAMVDAAIGGKNGVNFGGYKNMVGVINQPTAIFIHEKFLSTLSEHEIKNGFAESLKHTLIADAELYDKLTIVNCTSAALIHQSAKVKLKIVTQDEHEKLERKALNFGHTIAHALESFAQANHQELSHGYAVAYGMYCESYISLKKGLISNEIFNNICSKIKLVFEPYVGTELNVDKLLQLMKNDKKNDEYIRFSLINDIGSYSINQQADCSLISESINYFKTNYR